MATKTDDFSPWGQFCAAMGLPEDFDLPGLPIQTRYRVVGNGVPVPVARMIAEAIRDHLYPADLVAVCICGCARRVRPGATMATAACRQRMKRRRDAQRAA